MSLYFKLLSITLFFTSVNMSLKAQEVKSLDQAIESALKNSPTMKTIKLEAEKMSFLSDAAYKIPKTEFEGSFGQMNTRTGDQSYSISQSYNFAEAKAAKEFGKISSTKSSNYEAQAKNDLRFQVRNLWNDIEFHEEKQQLVRQQKELINAHSVFAERQFSLGEISKTEKTLAKLDLKKISKEEMLVNRHLETLKLQLSKLIGQDDFKTDQFEVAKSSIIEINKNDVQTNLAYESIQQDIKIAEAETKLESAQRKPDFTIGYFFQSIEGELEVDNQIVYYDRTPSFQGVTLGISLPLFGKAYKASEKISASNIKIAESKAEEISFYTKNKLDELNGKMSAAQNNFEFYENEAIPMVNEIKESLEKKQKTGEIGFSEYEHNMDVYFETMEEYIHAIKELNEVIFELMYLNNK